MIVGKRYAVMLSFALPLSVDSIGGDACTSNQSQPGRKMPVRPRAFEVIKVCLTWVMWQSRGKLGDTDLPRLLAAKPASLGSEDCRL